MDFLIFIHSQEVRDHLKQIGYRFSAPSAACVVRASQNHTLEEKHEAYDDICTRFEDPEFVGFLKEYKAMETALLDSFYQAQTGETYTFDMVYNGFAPRIPGTENHYNMLEDAFAAAFHGQLCVAEEVTGNFPSYCIFKKYSQDNEPLLCMVTAATFEPLEVAAYGEQDTLSKQFFKYDLSAHIPLPFAKGECITPVWGQYEVGNPDVLPYKVMDLPTVFDFEVGPIDMLHLWNYQVMEES